MTCLGVVKNTKIDTIVLLTTNSQVVLFAQVSPIGRIAKAIGTPVGMVNKMSVRKMRVKDIVDEVMTDMTDMTFAINAKDKINFRDLLLMEISSKLKEENFEIIPDDDEYDWR